MDLLSAIEPNAVLFLGKCGGLEEKKQTGRSDPSHCCNTGSKVHRTIICLLKCRRSRHLNCNALFLQQSVPMAGITGQARSLPLTGRVWEYDEDFKEYLRITRSMAIDMESATIFTVGFANEIPCGSLLLVTDQPMISSGIKTEESDRSVNEKFTVDHLQIGIDSMIELLNNGESVKHLRFD